MPPSAGRHASPFSMVRKPLPASLAKGIPITEVSRWLGHKSIEVTRQIYGHLVPASWDRARTILDDARRRPAPAAAGQPVLIAC